VLGSSAHTEIVLVSLEEQIVSQTWNFICSAFWGSADSMCW